MVEGFTWILPERLAGSARPGWMRALDDDLASLRREGISLIVSLTARPLELPPDSGFEVRHFPILDMGIPTPRATVDLCRDLIEAMEEGRRVLLHCRGGIGRTGTIAACCLVSLGGAAEDAVSQVRTRSRHYIQTEGQERFVGHYADHLRDLDERGELPAPLRRPGSRSVYSLLA